MSETHLWQVDHPYYGAEGTLIEVGSIDELIENVNECAADLADDGRA